MLAGTIFNNNILATFCCKILNCCGCHDRSRYNDVGCHGGYEKRPSYNEGCHGYIPRRGHC